MKVEKSKCTEYSFFLDVTIPVVTFLFYLSNFSS